MLLDSKVDIHAERSWRIPSHLIGFNAIQLAISSGHQIVIDILDSHGATIFTKSHSINFCFITAAVARGTIGFAKPMLTEAANLDAGIVSRGLEVLIQAVEWSHDSIVNILLETGFSPFSDPYGESPTLRESAFMVALRRNEIR